MLSQNKSLILHRISSALYLVEPVWVRVLT
nr:MAG TPA: hypothetical protein [Caudoviricetes sp.]